MLRVVLVAGLTSLVVELGCAALGEPDRGLQSPPQIRSLAGALPLSGTERDIAFAPRLRNATDSERRGGTPGNEGVIASPAAGTATTGVDLTLVATATRTWVYLKPTLRSRRLGYLRSGRAISLESPPLAGTKECAGGFAPLPGKGFVCLGRQATLLPDPAFRQAERSPDFDSPLPYNYALTRRGRPQLYRRIPTSLERLGQAGRGTKVLPLWRAVQRDPVPAFLREGQATFGSAGIRRSSLAIGDGQLPPRSGVALTDVFESEGALWGLTPSRAIVSLRDMQPVRPSDFAGVELSSSFTLPVAFVRNSGSVLYSGTPGTGLRRERRIGYREAFSLSGKTHKVRGVVFAETREGLWLKESSKVTVVRSLATLPGWAQGERSWLDVSTETQSLVAYRGATPIFATLVSTGRDGMARLGLELADQPGPADPSMVSTSGGVPRRYTTPAGQFVVHTKHISKTMRSDSQEEAHSYGEVPYVQYFHAGYALHAAYWHDEFGTARSNGCINLSPLDAKWLFGWSLPPVPAGWYGALSPTAGTLLRVRQ